MLMTGMHIMYRRRRVRGGGRGRREGEGEGRKEGRRSEGKEGGGG